MLPLILDLARLGVFLIGDGQAAERRFRLLTEAGAESLRVFAPRPSATLVAAAGPRLAHRLPDSGEIATARLVFLSNRAAPYVADIATRARAGGVLVHIEDDPARSDFQLPAVLRRGDLSIAVSTGGASPALAVRLRDALSHVIGPEWCARTEEIARLRRTWRAEGVDAEALKHRTADWIDRGNWLPEPTPRS